ncbi:hypothetical protein ASC85_25650 [Pseudomonas sp. Root401]|nr:hypothetical protein ASC85_25650 [Pseudomonas sp. Root401]
MGVWGVRLGAIASRLAPTLEIVPTAPRGNASRDALRRIPKAERGASQAAFPRRAVGTIRWRKLVGASLLAMAALRLTGR